jgi:hypothetical protein
MKEQLIHILDQSVCLSRKQMKEYIGGTMQREEMHAAQIHLNSCPLCSMAMDGFEAHSEEALAAIASLNSGFLKEHFDNIAPQIHLNSIAPAASLPASHAHKSGHIQPVWRTASIAAGILLVFGALWYIEFGRDEHSASKQIAMSEAVPAPASQQLAPGTDGSRRKSDASNESVKAVVAATESTGLDAKTTAANDDYVSEMSASPAAAPVTSKGLVNNEKPVALAAKAPAPAQAMTDTDASSRNRESQPGARETVEKLPLRGGDQEIASLSTKVYSPPKPSPQESYAVNTETLKKKELAKLEERAAPSSMELGKESFDKGKYGIALGHYKKQMNSTSADRNQAKIMAARCYVALGNKARAAQLLQAVIDEGTGPERRAAKRELRAIE